MEWSIATFHASAGSTRCLGWLFVALWAATYLTTCGELEGLDLLRDGDRLLFARRGFRWDATNGTAFLGSVASC